jgi:RimJ/RimL family protein N-acetyltransferase
MYIETPRLIIRDLQEPDAEALASLWADPKVTTFLGGARDKEEIRKTLIEDAKTAKEVPYDLRTVIEKESGEIVGHCGLLDKEVDGQREIEVTYVLAKRVWGRGYATEAASAIKDFAFGHMGLMRLIALIKPNNISSERVALKVGMHREKDTVRPDGTLMQVYAMEKDHA